METGMFRTADGYDRLIGRFLPPLAPAFADFAAVREGRVLDVGCGPGRRGFGRRADRAARGRPGSSAG